jgi:hypothetical protein
MINIKGFLLILILTLSFQTLSMADDISDFQIEGMSIGDSLLDYASKRLIENKLKVSYPNSDKFYLVEFDSAELNLSGDYTHFSFHLKKNDNNFKIYSVKGMNIYDNKLDACLGQKKIIVNSIKNSLTNAEEILYENYFQNTFGNSKAYISDFETKNGFIRIWCTNWDKIWEEKNGWKDTINIDLSNDIFLDWLNNKAYK